MIAYFDTSAVVPLLVDEPGTARATTLWNEADRVVSVLLVYPEARAALALAHRLGRLSPAQLRAAVDELDAQLARVDLVGLDEALTRRAGELAEHHHLRGYDAVHLAAADRVRDRDLVVVAGDEAFLTAAEAEGIAVAATTG